MLVKSLQPNRWGIYDCIGNVAEFCLERWDSQSPRERHVPGDWQVLLGGSWFHHPGRSRSGSRSAVLPDEGTAFNGFRVLIETPDQ